MKIATVKLVEEVELNAPLSTGDHVEVKLNDCAKQFNNHVMSCTVQSVARDHNSMVYVMTAGTNTLIAKIGSAEHSMLIGQKITSVNIVEMTSRKGVPVTADENGVLSYMKKQKKVVPRPVVAGDKFQSDRREFIVEYVAEDGSLICRMYSRKTNDYMGMTVIDGVDQVLLKSLYGTISFSEK